MAAATAAVDRMVAATRKAAEDSGQASALDSAGIAIGLMPPEHLAGFLQAAIARLAFPPEELPSP